MSRTRRTLLLTWVALASTLYLVPFASGESRQLFDTLLRVQIAAAISWPVFGLALYLPTRWRPGVWAWFDACLGAMSVGLIVMLLAAGASVVLPGVRTIGFQAATLCATNLVMLALFLPPARRLGMSAVATVGVWVGGLLAPFLCILFLLRQSQVG